MKKLILDIPENSSPTDLIAVTLALAVIGFFIFQQLKPQQKEATNDNRGTTKTTTNDTKPIGGDGDGNKKPTATIRSINDIVKGAR